MQKAFDTERAVTLARGTTRTRRVGVVPLGQVLEPPVREPVRDDEQETVLSTNGEVDPVCHRHKLERMGHREMLERGLVRTTFRPFARTLMIFERFYTDVGHHRGPVECSTGSVILHCDPRVACNGCVVCEK